MKARSLLPSLALPLAFAACVGSAPFKEDAPRRSYASVDTGGKKIADMFVAAPDFAKDEYAPSEQSRKMSACLLAKDLGLFDELTDGEFDALGRLFFAELPAENAVKEIVIPGLSGYAAKGDEKSPVERDAYFFISRLKTDDGSRRYRIETNIPISSLYAKTYDGYLVSRNSNYYKDKVPASWVAVMGISCSDDMILYKGVAYPSRVAPLFFSGTGIAPDAYFKNILAPGASIRKIMDDLESTVKGATAEAPSDEKQKQSMLFLKKYAANSLAFYAFLAGDPKAARAYLEDSKAVEVEAPDDARGSQSSQLFELMARILK